MAWGLFLDNAWRVRVALGSSGGLVLGIETEAAVARLVRNDVPRETAEDLIAACEQGFVQALNQRDDDGE